MRLKVPEPFSGGILLSYKCTNECRHCMYACSPRWSEDWISFNRLERILSQLASKMAGRHPPVSRISVNYGLHLTGGEPFLNFDLLVKAVETASELGIPGLFAETNCFWCTSERVARERLAHLKEAGLQGLLVSANPFQAEWVPLENIERAYQVALEIFGAENVIVYHELFYQQLKSLKVKGRIRFEEYLKRMETLDPEGLREALSFPSLLPMGRMPYRLGSLYRKYPAEHFFEYSCLRELTREWHTHIDNYGNYITGYCAGITLGNAENLEELCREGLDLEEYPVLKALTERLGNLYRLALEHGYEKLPEGYISKCHLCLDLRKHLARTGLFKELQPREFYEHL